MCVRRERKKRESDRKERDQSSEEKERKGKEREKNFKQKKFIIAFVTVPLFTHAKLFGI